MLSKVKEYKDLYEHIKKTNDKLKKENKISKNNVKSFEEKNNQLKYQLETLQATNIENIKDNQDAIDDIKKQNDNLIQQITELTSKVQELSDIKKSN
jgi:hypothetical protein